MVCGCKYIYTYMYIIIHLYIHTSYYMDVHVPRRCSFRCITMICNEHQLPAAVWFRSIIPILGLVFVNIGHHQHHQPDMDHWFYTMISRLSQLLCLHLDHFRWFNMFNLQASFGQSHVVFWAKPLSKRLAATAAVAEKTSCEVHVPQRGDNAS